MNKIIAFIVIVAIGVSVGFYFSYQGWKNYSSSKDWSDDSYSIDEETILSSAKQGAIEKAGGLLINGKRMYQLIVTLPPDKTAQEVIERFFNSFKLL